MNCCIQVVYRTIEIFQLIISNLVNNNKIISIDIDFKSFQVSKQLSVLAGFHSEDDRLNEFREAMGVMQHHDAVTGTEKQKVASDYARILHNSMRLGEDVASEALR